MSKYWRTNFWYKTARLVAKLPINHKFRFSSQQYKIKPPFIVLCNHTTDYDALLMAGAFKEPIHFVISDHVTSIPVAGKLINHFVGTIPITKSTIDASTVRKMMRVAKNGGAIGVFPEGNKSFAGKMSYVKPSIAKVIKKLNIPVVIYNIEGGYFTSPRWTKLKRKGYTHGYVRCILQPEQFATLSDDELYNQIITNLSVEAYGRQGKNRHQFTGKDLSRHIEQLLYMCPICGSFNSVYGEFNHIKCHNCDLLGEFDNYGYISGAPFARLDEWDTWQKERLREMQFEPNKPIFKDDNVLVKQKINNLKNQKLGRFNLTLFPEKLMLEPLDRNSQPINLELKDITGYGIEGANGLQLWIKDNHVYRIKGKTPTNGLKYVNAICVLTGQPMHF